LGDDEPSALEDAPDRGGGRHFGDGGVAGEVFGYGGRAGVEAVLGERLAQSHDLVFDLDGHRPRIVMGPARARRERRIAFGLVAPHELLYPGAGDVVVTGDFAFAASFQHDGGDDELRLRHGRQTHTTRAAKSAARCLSSGVQPSFANCGVWQSN
jgi:hypothetical protein